MARHETSRADRAEKCMFAAVTFADYAAKRGCSSVSFALSRTGMGMSVCVYQDVLGTGRMSVGIQVLFGASVCLCMGL